NLSFYRLRLHLVFPFGLALPIRDQIEQSRELVPPWRYDFAARRDSMFHIVRSGSAYLQVEDESCPIRLEDGDLVLFPTGHPHSLYDDPTSPLTRLVHLDYNPQWGHFVVNHEGNGTPLL